jgi:transcriptional regulator with GAF, ATPase, and Fis domain
LARPRGSRGARWFEALREASRAALRSEPDAAIAAALSTLRQAFGPSVPAPELWQMDPPQRVVVDLAGYVQAQRAEPLPKELLELARGEPEQTLRTEVLERLEVRRSDVRAPLEWMRTREAIALMLLADEDGPIGALLLPEASCPDPFGLEEVRALRALADRLAALLAVSSTLARSRARELSAQKAADRHEDRALEFEHRIVAAEKRHEAFAARLAHGALVAPYSAAARLASNELERLGKLGAPVSMLTPPGVDPVPYAALVHRAGPHRAGPFVVVDAEAAKDQLVSTWKDAQSSPLCLSNGGTLCILTVAALPAEAQLFLASALAERRSPGLEGCPLDVGLVVSVPKTVDSLVAAGQLEASLADRLGDHSVPLPPLAARVDDHRALFLERVCRLGLRLRGRPMGLDPHALAHLRNHAWPGNDLEANDVLLRAALVATGDVVTCDDLDRIGFVATPPLARRGSRPPVSGTSPGEQPELTKPPIDATASLPKPGKRRGLRH